MRAVWRAVGGLLLLATGTGRADSLPPAFLDAGADVVVTRIAVPSDARKVGEVRLVTRGRATVVQTLLATKVLRRVVDEIRKKEDANWPPGTPGREDMEQYLGVLDRAVYQLFQRRDATEDAERRLRLLIEFVATTDATGLLVGEFVGDEVDGHLAPTERRMIETVPLQKTYVFRNMRLILADAFDRPGARRRTSRSAGPDRRSRSMTRAGDLLAHWRTPWLAVVAVITVLLGVQAARVGIEHDNASLNATDPAQAQTYADFKATFGNDEDLLLAMEHPALLGPEGLALVDDVTRAVGRLDGVRRVWSLTTVEELVPGDAGPEPRPIVSPPWDARATEAALDRNPDLAGWLVSADRRTAGFVIQIDDRPDDAEYRSRLIDAVRARMATDAHDGVTFHLTGVPVQKHDVAAYVDRDQRVLLPLAVVVLGATLAAFFRRPAGVAIPLGVAGLTVVWTTGLYAWTGHDLNAITSLLPPVLLVVALAASVHVYEAWGTATGDGPERAAAAVRAIALPAVLCAVTTAQGFVSLAVSQIPAVQQLGFFAAFGSLAACLLGLTAAPAALSWLRPPVTGRTSEHAATLRLLDACSGLATRRPTAVLATFGAVTLLAMAGIPLVRANTDLVGFLRADAPLRRDTAFVDAHLGGTLPLDFVLRRRDGAPVRSLDAYRRLGALEDAIRALPHVTTVTSVLAVLRQVERAESGGTLALPTDERRLADALDLLEESGHDLVRRFAGPELRTLRLSVRLRAVGTAESAPLVDRILADAARLLGSEYTLVPTGALYHVVHDSTRLVQQQVTSFGAAIVLVVLAIGVIFRSVTFTVLALIPNVMPILWTGGLMGFAGIELSTGTAMIASTVLGLVVDDTIYYLSHYQRVYRGDAEAAIHATTRAVGAPVTAASVSLVLGFWVGALGSFQPTIYFSLLTGLTMITGVACDLLVLPASLVAAERLGRR
jgi:predicted RND superfamily exporter protein